MSDKEKKLKWYTKIAYGFGEVGSQFSWGMISSYLTLFYTDVVGLAPSLISCIMIIARVWDAVNDPIFGAIAENTNTKWGRFRPYILFGCPVLALFNCLAFLNLDIPRIWKTFWCIFTYIGCGMAYTAVNISVGCLTNSMTSCNNERVSLNAVRGAMGSAGGMVLGGTAMPLILHYSKNSVSYGNSFFITALIFSMISIPCMLICGIFTRETVFVKRQQRRGNTTLALVRSFKYTFKDKNARFLILAEFCFLTGIFGRLGIMSYYFIYVLKKSELIAGFSVALSLGMLLANALAAFLMVRMDKKWVGVLTSICQAMCCILFFIIGEKDIVNMVIPIGFIYGLTNFSGNVAYGMSAEIIDDNWLSTGIRSDGVIYSCISFSTKLGSAVGGAIGILALGAVGFTANAELSKAVLTEMNKVINFGPAFFFIVSAVMFAKNGMTNAKGKQNEEKIAEMVR